MYVKKHEEEDYSDFGKQQKRLYNAQINASLSQNQVFKEYLIRLTFQQQENWLPALDVLSKQIFF